MAGVALPAERGQVSAAAHTRCGGRGRAEEQRQVPAGRPELFMGGVLYSLAQIGAAVQCYPRALPSPPPPLSGSRSL